MIDVKLFFFIVFQIFVLIKCEEAEAQERDFHKGYFAPSEDEKIDYQGLRYPSNYYNQHFMTNDDEFNSNKNSLLPFMDTVLKLIMLKLGVLGVVKVVSAIIFVGLAAKTLIFMTKMTFLKSIFLPFLAIPLLVQFMMNNVTQSGDDMMEEKPQETSTNPNIMNMISSEGRRLSVDDPISATWESVKSFAESEQCIERISCLLGASNNDSAAGNFFFEVLKFLDQTSPPGIQDRMSLITEAYNKGRKTSVCSEEEFKCRGSDILIKKGLNNVKLF